MRYLITTQFYINTQDDETAVFKAKYIAARQNSAKNDECKVIDVTFGDFDKVIYPNKKGKIEGL